MVFDTKTHTYIDNETSKVLISCTELLKKHNLAPKYDSVDSEILRLASERGTLIHKEIEDYIKKGERGFTKELGNFIKEIQYQEIEILESEQLLHNDIVAGTCDFLYKDKDNKLHRADFKTTSTIHKDYVSWQLSLYDHLDTTKANYFEVWHFDKEGYLTIKQLAPKPITEIEKLLNAERKGEIYQSETMELSEKEINEISMLLNVIDTAKKNMEYAENQLATLRDSIKEQMENRGIKAIKNDNFTITYKAPTTRQTVDSARLKVEQPDIYSQYLKETNIKSSIEIKLKKEKTKWVIFLKRKKR